MSSGRVAAVIAAGGLGARFSPAGGEPKQFQLLGGRPMYVWSFLAISEHPQVATVVLVVPENAVSQVERRLDLIRQDDTGGSDVIVTAGGASRQESVYIGLRTLAGCPAPPDYVLIHDAARPFIDTDTVGRVIHKVIEYGAVTVGAYATDTIKRVRDDKIIETPARQEMLITQTPQAGRLRDLLRGHELAAERRHATTDDASLLEFLGLTVHVVAGSPYNFKVTSPLDLIVAEALSNTLLKDRL